MSKFYNADNPFTKFMYRLGNIVLLNVYFLVCCLPIVTIGASLTAMNKVAYTLGETVDTKITSLFFKTFVSNLLDSTLIWIIIAGIATMAGYTAYVGIKMAGTKGTVLCVVGFALIITMLLIFTYVFMLIARYDNLPTRQIFNAFMISVGNFGWTIVIWLIWGLPIIAFITVPYLLQILGWVWILCGFAFLGALTAKIYRRLLKKVEQNED